MLRESDKPNSFLSPEQQKKAREAGPRMVDMARRMHAAGVKVAFGTDTGVSAHGDNAQEFALLVKAGFCPDRRHPHRHRWAPPSTSISPSEIGSIAANKAADIIAVKGDPLANVRVDWSPSSFVMKGGKSLQAVDAIPPLIPPTRGLLHGERSRLRPAAGADAFHADREIPSRVRLLRPGGWRSRSRRRLHTRFVARSRILAADLPGDADAP